MNPFNFFKNTIPLLPKIPKQKPISIEVHYDDFQFDLGDELTDIVTGVRGVVIGSTQWVNNCNTFKMACMELDNDGKHKEELSIDAPLLKLYSSSSINVNVPYLPFEYDLGDTVRSTLDGFEGIIGARCSWLAGCNNYLIKPQGLEPNGSIKQGEWLAERSLEVIHKNPYFKEVEDEIIKPSSSFNTGGPTDKVLNNKY